MLSKSQHILEIKPSINLIESVRELIQPFHEAGSFPHGGAHRQVLLKGYKSGPHIGPFMTEVVKQEQLRKDISIYLAYGLKNIFTKFADEGGSEIMSSLYHMQRQNNPYTTYDEDCTVQPHAILIRGFNLAQVDEPDHYVPSPPLDYPDENLIARLKSWNVDGIEYQNPRHIDYLSGALSIMFAGSKDTIPEIHYNSCDIASYIHNSTGGIVSHRQDVWHRDMGDFFIIHCLRGQQGIDTEFLNLGELHKTFGAETLQRIRFNNVNQAPEEVSQYTLSGADSLILKCIPFENTQDFEDKKPMPYINDRTLNGILEGHVTPAQNLSSADKELGQQIIDMLKKLHEQQIKNGKNRFIFAPGDTIIANQHYFVHRADHYVPNNDIDHRRWTKVVHFYFGKSRNWDTGIPEIPNREADSALALTLPKNIKQEHLLSRIKKQRSFTLEMQ